MESNGSSPAPAAPPPPPRRRGRPVGARDRVPRVRRAPDEMAEAEENENEGGEGRMSRQEAVEHQFNELNKDVKRTRVSQNEDGMTVIRNETEVLSEELMGAAAELQPNPDKVCVPPEEIGRAHV